MRDEKTANTEIHTINKVSDPSNVPYQFITYSSINAAGRQWIRKMTLALAKELLGIIRSKYASMPLPNGEVSLDGEGLKAEGREEKQQLLEELKELMQMGIVDDIAVLAETDLKNKDKIIQRKYKNITKLSSYFQNPQGQKSFFLKNSKIKIKFKIKRSRSK